MGERVGRLTAEVDRSGFACGVETIDRWFRDRSLSWQRQRIATTYVLLNAEDNVDAFYTLSAASTVASAASGASRRKPSRIEWPAVLIGQLAVHEGRQGEGLGRLLVGEAVNRCVAISEGVAVMYVLTDPINGAARAFYRSLDFLDSADGSDRMFLPLKSVDPAGG